MSTSSSRYAHQDDISIQIDQSTLQKSDDKLTQQLYEMAQRIAESDRNNQAYRSTKKNKSFELALLKKNQRELQEELEKLDQSCTLKQRKITQNSMFKKQKEKYQRLHIRYEEQVEEEKQLQLKNVTASKENQQLQKKLSALQSEYNSIKEENNRKNMILEKLKKKKQEKLQKINMNSYKIQQFTEKCETTKKKAETLQNELRKQIQLEKQLQINIKEKQKQLDLQRREKEQNFRRNQQNKRNIAKMAKTVQAVEMEIDKKWSQVDQLREVHNDVKVDIDKLEESQRKMEQFLMNRREMIKNIKKCSQKVQKQEDVLCQIRQQTEQNDLN